MSLQQLAREALQRRANVIEFFSSELGMTTLQESHFMPASSRAEMQRNLIAAARRGSVHAVAGEMAPAVTHAASTMPEDERVLEDDLLSRSGILYLDSAALMTTAAGTDTPVLVDTLFWRTEFWRSRRGFSLIAFADRDRNRDIFIDYERRRDQILPVLSIGHSVQWFDDPIRDWKHGAGPVPGGSGESEFDQMPITWLSVMRIMQQSYSSVVIHRPPKGIAKRLERAGHSSEVQVILFRRRRTAAAEPTGRQLETRHIRDGHWRRHQHYKNDAGEWAEKSIYIAATVVGPDGAPFVLHEKVRVLQR